MTDNSNDPFAARDPEGAAHQFHNAGFGSDALQAAMSELVTHLADLFTGRPETWTDTLIVFGFLDGVHEGQSSTNSQTTAMMGNHTGVWGVDWNFSNDTYAALLSEVVEQRHETRGEWNVLAVRLSRTTAQSEQVNTQVRAFPVPDPIAFLQDDNDLIPMLGGVFPYFNG